MKWFRSINLVRSRLSFGDLLALPSMCSETRVTSLNEKQLRDELEQPSFKYQKIKKSPNLFGTRVGSRMAIDMC